MSEDMALADFVLYRTDRKYSLTPAGSVVCKGTVLERRKSEPLGNSRALNLQPQ